MINYIDLEPPFASESLPGIEENTEEEDKESQENKDNEEHEEEHPSSDPDETNKAEGSPKKQPTHDQARKPRRRNKKAKEQGN